jgi:hypothetical protein
LIECFEHLYEFRFIHKPLYSGLSLLVLRLQRRLLDLVEQLSVELLTRLVEESELFLVVEPLEVGKEEGQDLLYLLIQLQLVLFEDVLL